MREQTHRSPAGLGQHPNEGPKFNADWLRRVATVIQEKGTDPCDYPRKVLRPLLSKWAAFLVWNSAVKVFAEDKGCDPAEAHLHLGIDGPTSSQYRNGKRIPMLDKFAALVAFAAKHNISDKVVPPRKEIVGFAVPKATTELRTRYFQEDYDGPDLTREEIDLLYTVLFSGESADLLGEISMEHRDDLYRRWLGDHFKRWPQRDVADIGRLGDVIAYWGQPFALLHLGLVSELNYNVTL